jgi:hypothetical protein
MSTTAAIYARYSSDRQSDASIEDQARLCEERARREGCRVVETYADRAISGASMLRPGLQVHVTAELPLTDTLRLRGGWASDFFIPQPWGRPPWELFPLEDSLWHLGGPFVVVAWRFPYTVEGM